MPIKYNLMNYDIIANNIHKIQAKDDSELSDNERRVKTLGVLIASFSSSFSWQTYKRVIDGGNMTGVQGIKEEFEIARKSNWKQVRNTDVQEVVRTFSTMPKASRDRIFFDWLFLYTDREMHEQLKYAWSELEKDLKSECDSVD